MGYEVASIVDTGADAIKKAEDDKPDLILMDIRINGEMDGIETAEIIRNRCKIPIIFLTAYLDQERIDRAKVTIPFGCVLKPIREKDLKAMIEMALYAAKVDKERKLTEEKLSLAFYYAAEPMAITRLEDGIIVDVNNAVLAMSGIKKDELIGKPAKDLNLYSDLSIRKTILKSLEESGFIKDFEMDANSVNGIRKCLFSANLVTINNEKCMLSTLKDITALREAEVERERLIKDLQNALDNVKKLEGMLPICASCKKIKDDKGYWNQLEAYIENRSEALFSHGICPECVERLYGDSKWFKKKTAVKDKTEDEE